jgi:hypothetical protein
MLAYQMNGEQSPLLNGFPLRLIVPGSYSTYRVKMLNHVEVLNAPDENYWMKTAYRIPDTPCASVKPSESAFRTVPINRMVPRFFFTNVSNNTIVKPAAPVPVSGIAFGGDCGVSQVELSVDGGRSCQKTRARSQRGHVQLSPMEHADNGTTIRNSDTRSIATDYDASSAVTASSALKSSRANLAHEGY